MAVETTKIVHSIAWGDARIEAALITVDPCDGQDLGRDGGIEITIPAGSILLSPAGVRVLATWLSDCATALEARS